MLNYCQADRLKVIEKQVSFCLLGKPISAGLIDEGSATDSSVARGGGGRGL